MTILRAALLAIAAAGMVCVPTILSAQSAAEPKPHVPLEKSIGAILAGYSREELKTLLDFFERSGEVLLARVAELNDGK